MFDKEEVGKRIESIRNDLGMSKTKFADMIGVSGQYLGTVEKGINGFSVEIITNICEKTGASADYILLGINDPFQKFAGDPLFSGLSQEQIQIAFDIMKKVATFIKTEDGNEALIQEIFKMSQAK